MVYDTLKNIGRYKLDSRIIYALEQASKFTSKNYSTDLLEFQNGDFIMPSEYQTQNTEKIVMEAHRKYIDVMYMVEGSEAILIKHTDTLSNITLPYNDEEDALIAEEGGAMSSVILQAGDFVILYPQDAHCPACAVDSVPQQVKKVICKIRL